MGISGNTTSYIDFQDSVSSAPLNQRFINRFPTGIYYGADLSIISNTSVSVSQFDIEITDGTHLMKATSSGANTVTVSPTNIYVYFTWTYTGTANDVPALGAGSTVPSNAVLVGQCVYSGSTLQGFNLTNRNDAPSFGKFCFVEPTNPASLSVKVRAGSVASNTQTYFIVEQPVLLSTSGLSAGQSVINVVVVNSSGGIAIVTGTPATTGSQIAPSYGGAIPLALITLTYGQTTITATSIQDARSFLVFPYVPSSVVILPTYSGSDPVSPVNGQIWLRTDL